MTFWNKFPGYFLGGSALFFGTCALFEYFPGESIGVVMFAQLAERFGAVQTGMWSIVIGLALIIYTRVTRPGDAGGDGGFGGDCGGDGGD